MFNLGDASSLCFLAGMILLVVGSYWKIKDKGDNNE